MRTKLSLELEGLCGNAIVEIQPQENHWLNHFISSPSINVSQLGRQRFSSGEMRCFIRDFSHAGRI